jgi:hypothetical protein
VREGGVSELGGGGARGSVHWWSSNDGGAACEHTHTRTHNERIVIFYSRMTVIVNETPKTKIKSVAKIHG